MQPVVQAVVGCTMTVVQPVVQPVIQPVASCKRGIRGLTKTTILSRVPVLHVHDNHDRNARSIYITLQHVLLLVLNIS